MRRTGAGPLLAVALGAGVVGWLAGESLRDTAAPNTAAEVARLEAENEALRARVRAAVARPPALTGRPEAPARPAEPPPARGSGDAPEDAVAPDDDAPAAPRLVDLSEVFASGYGIPGAFPEEVRDLLELVQDRVDLHGVLRGVVLDPDVSATKREHALSMLVAADPEVAVDLVRSLLRSRDEVERQMARRALTAARDRAFLPLLDEAIDRPEKDESPVPYLNAIARLKGSAWGIVQITGPPDTPIGGDMQTAWASASADMGEVTIELDYAVAVRPDAVRVHETYNPGAIARVAVRTPAGWVTVWEGRAPGGTAPRWFDPPLATIDGTIRTVLLVLDTNRVAGWNEIDAVELVGDGRRQWGVDARASSSYGDRAP